MLFGPTRAAELLRSSDAEAVLPAYQLSGELLTHQQSPIRQLSTIECGHYMRNTLLRDVDVMSMAHALEVRVPLIDHQLVEMVMALDDGLKLDNKTPKPLLVRALGSALPASVVRRPKQGFAFPFDVWLRGGMGRQVRDALCSGSSPVADLLDPVGLARVWTDFAGGRLSWSRPWALFVLNHWLEQHLAK
jgi:asparagine synthase (glutamine-hydrolysing)